MKMYRTTGILSISSGEIKLDEKQVARRAHMLIETGRDGVFLPKGELFFKVGEVVGLAVVSKAMMKILEPLDEQLTEAEHDDLGDEQLTEADKKKPGRPRK